MKKYKSYLIAITLICALVSCTDDQLGDDANLEPDLATNSLDQLSNDLEADVIEMVNSQGTRALTSLIDLITEEDVFTGRAYASDRSTLKRLKKKVRSFKKAFIPDNPVMQNDDEDRFIFQENLGVYHWDIVSGEFIKSDEQIDHIRIDFPSEGSTQNNASLRILDYQEKQYIEYGEESFYPTVIIADIVVDEVLEASLNFDVGYDDNAMPKSGVINLFVAPFDYQLRMDDQSETESLIAVKISRDQLSILSTEVNISFATGQKDEVTSVDGSVEYGKYSMSGSIDIQSVENAAPEADINDHINLVIFDSGNKLGDVILEKIEGEEDYNALVLFSDGSTQSLEDVLQPAIDEIEKFILEIEGES